MRFVEAKSIFSLLKSYKFFTSAYIKNVDFASTKRMLRPIHNEKAEEVVQRVTKTSTFLVQNRCQRAFRRGEIDIFKVMFF